MAAETENTLQKVDSLTEELKDGAAKKGHRRVSSMAADVYRIEDLGMCDVGRVDAGQARLTGPLRKGGQAHRDLN